LQVDVVTQTAIPAKLLALRRVHNVVDVQVMDQIGAWPPVAVDTLAFDVSVVDMRLSLRPSFFASDL